MHVLISYMEYTASCQSTHDIDALDKHCKLIGTLLPCFLSAHAYDPGLNRTHPAPPAECLLISQTVIGLERTTKERTWMKTWGLWQ